MPRAATDQRAWLSPYSAGEWEHGGRRYERVQIRTVTELLAKRGFETPAPVQPLDWERQGRLPF